MKIGFLFAGQGAQIAGMGKDFYESNPTFRQHFDEAKIDYDLKDVCFNQQATLDETEYAQSAIFAVSAAIHDCLSAEGIHPDCVAGLSLGEYSAYYAAKAYDFNTGLQITRARGKIMANALPSGTSAMAAILMLEESVLQEVCDEVSTLGCCVIANYNAPGQLVISGDTIAVEKAMELSLDKGARKAIRLNVSGAFHSPLLKDASLEFRDFLSNFHFNMNEVPLISNCDAQIANNETINLLSKQMASPVYFELSIKKMMELGIDTFIEIGPGKTISAFVRKIDRSLRVYNIDSVATFNQVVSTLKGENNE